MFTFPDPRASVASILTAAKPTHFPTATISTSFPRLEDANGNPTPLTAPWIQHAWDGTPSEEQQREFCTVRITAWAPKEGGVQISAAINLAALVKAVLLNGGDESVWRFTPGLGRSPGIDPDTGLPFCTFTVTAETRPQAVA